MFYRKLTIFVIASALYFCFGMANVPRQGDAAVYPETTKSQLESTFADIESAYESRNISDMMDLLDKNFEGWLDFKTSLQDYFFTFRNLQIHFVIDTYLTEKDKVNIRLHWFKKTMTSSGAFAKNQGSSEFIFKQAPEGLKLLYIRGDNPFF